MGGGGVCALAPRDHRANHIFAPADDMQNHRADVNCHGGGDPRKCPAMQRCQEQARLFEINPASGPTIQNWSRRKGRGPPALQRAEQQKHHHAPTDRAPRGSPCIRARNRARNECRARSRTKREKRACFVPRRPKDPKRHQCHDGVAGPGVISEIGDAKSTVTKVPIKAATISSGTAHDHSQTRGPIRFLKAAGGGCVILERRHGEALRACGCEGITAKDAWGEEGKKCAAAMNPARPFRLIGVVAALGVLCQA